MTTLLERIYASAPTDEFLLHTLEISNPVFLAPYRFVQDFEDLTATLETSEVVTFMASGIGLSLPQRGVQGREDLSFQLDNVSGDAAMAIRDAQDSGQGTDVIYRAYSSNDLSAPIGAPLKLIATSAKINIRSVQVVATFRDFVNKAWPRRLYSIDRFPGMKYLNG